MHTVYLLTGSNLSDREKNLGNALDLLKSKAGKVIRVSSVYETEPWGKEDQPYFLNQAIEIKAKLDPFRLLEITEEIEKAHNKKRIVKWGARTLDIDILFYEDRVIRERRLNIPHPFIPERRFALVPLSEIAGEWIHPVLNVSVNRLKHICPDNLEVSLFKSKEKDHQDYVHLPGDRRKYRGGQNRAGRPAR